MAPPRNADSPLSKGFLLAPRSSAEGLGSVKFCSTRYVHMWNNSVFEIEIEIGVGVGVVVGGGGGGEGGGGGGGKGGHSPLLSPSLSLSKTAFNNFKYIIE